MSETIAMPKKPTRHTMLIWVLVALFLCYVDRVIISLAAIEMKAELGWDDTAKGTVLASFFAGYLIMQPIGGILANRFGGRNVFLGAVLVWSLFTVLTPAASQISFNTLILARFMVGFGEGAAFPAVYSMLNQWMRKDEISTSFGYMTAATALGTIFALLVSGLIIAAYGWPSIFYLFGAMGVVWAVFWVLIVPAKPIYADDRIEDAKKEKSSIPWKILLTHPAAYSLYIIAVAGAMISFTLVTWMPSYFADTFNSTVTQAGIYSLFPFIAITIVSLIAGSVGDKLIKKGVPTIKIRKRMTYLGFVLSMVFLLLVTQSGSVLFSVFCLSFGFAALGIAIPAYSPMPGELLPNHGDILYGFMAAVASLANVFTIRLTGVMLDKTGSYNLTFFVICGVVVLALAVFAIFARNDPIYR